MDETYYRTEEMYLVNKVDFIFKPTTWVQMKKYMDANVYALLVEAFEDTFTRGRVSSMILHVGEGIKDE